MAQYTDPEATCVTPTPTDADPNMFCGHFVGDHGWDDPWKRQPGETTAVFNKRWAENNKSTKAAAEREKAALTRGACHVSTCPCMDFADGSVSQKERDAAANKREADAEAAFNARVDAAVAAALARSGGSPTALGSTPAERTATADAAYARTGGTSAAVSRITDEPVPQTYPSKPDQTAPILSPANAVPDYPATETATEKRARLQRELDALAGN